MREKKSLLETLLLPSFLVFLTLYVSSCANVGQFVFGKEYYNDVIRQELEILSTDPVSPQSRKTIDDVNAEILKPAKYKF